MIIIDNRPVLKRVLLAIMLSAVVTPWVWFVIDERSPFYSYLYHLGIKDIWWMINILPFMIAASASENPHGGTSMVLFLFAAFAQWFILFIFVSRLIINVSLKYCIIITVIYYIIIGISGWYVSSHRDLLTRLQTTHCSELTIRLEKEISNSIFASLDHGWSERKILKNRANKVAQADRRARGAAPA